MGKHLLSIMDNEPHKTGSYRVAMVSQSNTVIHMQLEHPKALALANAKRLHMVFPHNRVYIVHDLTCGKQETRHIVWDSNQHVDGRKKEEKNTDEQTFPIRICPHCGHMHNHDEECRRCGNREHPRHIEDTSEYI